MKQSVPNKHAAVLDPGKLVGYLLSREHPVGQNKARVFAGCGYDKSNADDLIVELKRVLIEGHLVEVVESSYGTKYIVEGAVPCFYGSTLGIRTVWIVETDTVIPRFVTAYPL